MDNSVLLWRFDSSNGLRQVGGPLPHAASIRAMAFAPNGSALAVAAGNVISLWPITATGSTGQPILLESHSWYVTALAYSADSRWLVTASYDGTARVWDTQAPPNSEPVAEVAVDRKRKLAVAISPDARWIALGSEASTLSIYEFDTAAHTLSLASQAGYDGAVRSLAFSPAGTMLLSGGSNHLVKLWEVTESGALREIAEAAATERCEAATLVWSRSSDAFVCPGKPGEICLWRVPPDAENAPRLVRTFDGMASAGAVRVALAADGSHLILGDAEGSLRVRRITDE